MILSNEPGFYKHGHYGIRIENLLLVREAETVDGGERPMHGLRDAHPLPDRPAADRAYALSTTDELAWLDAYHARVLKEVGAHLDGAELDWLKRACAPLS